MRSEEEMTSLIISFAKKDKRIRLVTLEGSRTNKNIPKDSFQDYDIAYFVTEMDSFKKNDKWLDVFWKSVDHAETGRYGAFPSGVG